MSTNYSFLRENERVLMEGSANMKQVLGITKGGKLILTTNRLVFMAHGFNVGAKFEEFPFSQIAGSGNKVNILIPTTNLIKIVLRDGKEKQFVVARKQKEQWKSAIMSAISGGNQVR